MKLIKILAFLIFISLMTGCEQSKDKTKIGINLPFTGTVAYYGQNAKRGIAIALNEITNSYPNEIKNIELVYEDNQGQAKKAITAISKLINIDKTPAIIGCGSSTESMATAPIADENKTVLISPISSATSLSTISPYFFRTCPTDFDQANDLGKWILEKGLKKIGVIYANSTWGTGFKSDFINYYKNHGGNVIKIESSEPGATNFRSQITILKSLDIDALVYITYAKEGGALVRQTRELGLKQEIFGADPWSQKDFRIGAGNYSNGIMYTTPIQHDGNKFNKFREIYKNKYNVEPDVYSSNGYDCMMILWDAFYNGQCRNGTEFQKYLQKINFNGVTGITKFDENGNVIGKHFGRFIIKDRKPVSIK